MRVNGILVIQMLSVFPTTKRDYIIELFFLNSRVHSVEKNR